MRSGIGQQLEQSAVSISCSSGVILKPRMHPLTIAVCICIVSLGVRTSGAERMTHALPAQEVRNPSVSQGCSDWPGSCECNKVNALNHRVGLGPLGLIIN